MRGSHLNAFGSNRDIKINVLSLKIPVDPLESLQCFTVQLGGREVTFTEFLTEDSL